jgi:hypothetical protein
MAARPGRTTPPRYGVEGSLFWRPTDWLTLDASAAATRARFHGVAPGATFIPNAVSNVISAGAAVDFGKGLSASLRLRHFGAAPLIEDDSVRSDPTGQPGAYYARGRIKLGLDVLNLFDAKDADITYFYSLAAAANRRRRRRPAHPPGRATPGARLDPLRVLTEPPSGPLDCYSSPMRSAAMKAPAGSARCHIRASALPFFCFPEASSCG